jgi:hypothetical protein
MQKNGTNEWKFIPSLKGKHGKTHIFILRTLTIQGPKSCWDLALEKLKHEQPRLFMSPAKDTIYHSRMLENSKLNKRLRFLESKGYVEKLGSVYKATLKGITLIVGVEPNVITLIPENRLKETYNLQVLSQKPNILNHISTKVNINKFKDTYKDSFKNENFSLMFRRMLVGWKINMDEISSEELYDLIITRVNKEIWNHK